MRARKTPSSNRVYRLAGGTEDNDLHVRTGAALDAVPSDDPCHGMPYVASVWQPDDAERAALATGSNLELTIIGNGVPPLMLLVTDEQPVGEAPLVEREELWVRIPGETARMLLDVLNPAAPGPMGSLPAGRLASEPELVELRATVARDLAVLEARARARGDE